MRLRHSPNCLGQRAIGRLRLGGARQQRGHRLARRLGGGERVVDVEVAQQSARLRAIRLQHAELENPALQIDRALEDARAARRTRLDHHDELRAARIRRRHQRDVDLVVELRKRRDVGDDRRRADFDAARAQPMLRASQRLATGLADRRILESAQRRGAGFEIGPGEREFLAVGRVMLEQPREHRRRGGRRERGEQPLGIAVRRADRVLVLGKRRRRGFERARETHGRVSARTQSRYGARPPAVGSTTSSGTS